MLRRTSLLSIALAVGVILVSAAVVYAGNPHFNSVVAALGSPHVVITASEVGLGSGASVTYEGSAHVTATAQCVNGGQQNPSASNKSFSGEVESTATAQADASGRITIALVLPALPSSFCPPGQTSVVTTATFSNITLTDTTNNVTAVIPGTLVYTAP
jgi:hypothetical protein